MNEGGDMDNDNTDRSLQAASQQTDKIAPVQGYAPGIPWSLHLEAYAAYCKKWAPQPALIDLEGRNCRGGFHVGELDEFAPGWRDRVAAAPQQPAQQAVRMLTSDELYAALPTPRTPGEYIGTQNVAFTWDAWQAYVGAVERKFCEVNGIALPPAAKEGEKKQ
jgi:hypothetical protein